MNKFLKLKDGTLILKLEQGTWFWEKIKNLKVMR